MAGEERAFVIALALAGLYLSVRDGEIVSALFALALAGLSWWALADYHRVG